MRIGVRTNDPSVLPDLIANLPHGSRIVPGRRVPVLLSVKAEGSSHHRAGVRRRLRRFSLLYRDHTLRARSLDLDEVLNSFATEAQVAVAEMSSRGVFVHAGVVGWRDRALLLPGVSWSGKSTLVRELVRQGATYYSDEYAILDTLGRVLPYARPLALRRKDPRKEPRHKIRQEVPADAIGRRALPVALVAFLRYEPRTGWRPRRVGPGQGFIELMKHAVPARSQPEATMRALCALSEDAVFLKGRRGEAETAAQQLLQQLKWRAKKR